MRPTGFCLIADAAGASLVGILPDHAVSLYAPGAWADSEPPSAGKLRAGGEVLRLDGCALLTELDPCETNYFSSTSFVTDNAYSTGITMHGYRHYATLNL